MFVNAVCDVIADRSFVCLRCLVLAQISSFKCSSLRLFSQLTYAEWRFVSLMINGISNRLHYFSLVIRVSGLLA